MTNLTKYNYKASINIKTFEFYYYIKYNKKVTHRRIIDMIESKNTYPYKFFYILFILQKRLKNHDEKIKNEQLNRLIKFLLNPDKINYI